MNVGIARIVIVAALAVGGIAVLATGFGGTVSAAGGGPSANPSQSSSPQSPSPSTGPSKSTPSPQVQGVQVAVFNGTYAAGLAAQVQQKLTGSGYAQAQPPADAPSKPVPKTVVYFRGGAGAAQNRSDAKYLARKYFKGARVVVLSSDVSSVVTNKDTQVAIVLGEDYKPTP